MIRRGHEHPINEFIDRTMSFLKSEGFDIYLTNEVETEYLNFDFLRVPDDHPARDVQDTFWVGDHEVLRTHTTGFQAHVMLDRGGQPPLKAATAGRVFRNEATDASHVATLHQLDGFAISQDASMAQMIDLFERLVANYFGERIKMRFVPHHYPFVEPGLDVFMRWQDKWLEVWGSGLMHPEVIGNMNLDPKVWRGFAWGMGIERLVALKYGISDIRQLYVNDARLIKQF